MCVFQSGTEAERTCEIGLLCFHSLLPFFFSLSHRRPFHVSFRFWPALVPLSLRRPTEQPRDIKTHTTPGTLRPQHMHIVNDNSRTFDIRLGGEARVPVSRELILALAAKKKQLLALCESTLRTPRWERESECVSNPEHQSFSFSFSFVCGRRCC